MSSTEIYASGFAPALAGEYLALAMNPVIANKIKRLRLELGLNQSELAEKLNVTQASVSRWEKGSVPDATRLAQLAQMAGETVGQFISGSPESKHFSGLFNRFWVRGAVAAGVWTVAYELPQTEWVAYSGLASIAVPAELRYGLRVDGESMNLVYPDGTILDCVRIDFFNELRNGQRVIVERIRTDGEIEATVKEYMRADDGKVWLIPRSNLPQFQTPISADEPGDGIAEVRVVAVVVGSYRPEVA